MKIPKNAKINVYFVGDEEIRALNKKHLHRDYATDVLSFNIDEKMPDGEYYIGDVIINIDEAKRQMKNYGNTDVRREIAELAEHGILHLLGIHHQEGN